MCCSCKRMKILFAVYKTMHAKGYCVVISWHILIKDSCEKRSSHIILFSLYLSTIYVSIHVCLPIYLSVSIYLLSISIYRIPSVASPNPEPNNIIPALPSVPGPASLRHPPAPLPLPYTFNFLSLPPSLLPSVPEASPPTCSLHIPFPSPDLLAAPFTPLIASTDLHFGGGGYSKSFLGW